MCESLWLLNSRTRREFGDFGLFSIHGRLGIRCRCPRGPGMVGSNHARGGPCLYSASRNAQITALQLVRWQSTGHLPMPSTRSSCHLEHAYKSSQLNHPGVKKILCAGNAIGIRSKLPTWCARLFLRARGFMFRAAIKCKFEGSE